MTLFPAFVYRSPGRQRRGIYVFDLMGVADQDAMDAQIEAGWHPTFDDAIKAAGDRALFTSNTKRAAWRNKKKKKPRKPSKPLDGVNRRLAVVAPVVEAIVQDAMPESQSIAPVTLPDDNAPPTRVEMEAQALKLGVKFDGRTTDKLLMARIEEAMIREE